MGMVGGIARAVSGAPNVKVTSAVKNTGIQSGIDSAVNNYGAMAASGDKALGDYISKYLSGQGAAEKRTGQEIGTMDQFYNGSMANQLAQLRTQRAGAMTSAADLATQQALRAQSGSRLTGEGGMSSYNSRMAIGALQPIRVQAALDNASQARNDFGYITGQQLGLTGQRNALAANQAAYGLVPEQMRLQMLQGRAGYLGQLTNMDQANKFYGLRQDPNRFADIADSADQGIMNAAAIYSSIGGGMGGMGGKARGGVVHGPGDETSDSIPIRVSDGEYILPAEVTDMPGVLPLLERIRHLALMERSRRARPIGGAPGYADGGLAQGAMWLGDRAMKDLSTNWMPATMIDQSTGGGGFGGGGGGGMAPAWRRNPMVQTPAGVTGRMPGDWGSEMPQSSYFTPNNYGGLSPEARMTGSYWANYYNNPSSAGFVAPGTFE